MWLDRQIRLRRLILVGIYLLAAAWGLVVLQHRDTATSLLFTALLASAMVGWCVVDSQILGRPLLHSLYLPMFMSWLLSVPLYLVWSRRLRGALLAIVHGFALLVAYAAPAIAWQVHASYRWQRLAQDGYAALERQDCEQAVTLLRQAVEISPHDAASWHNLGVAWQHTGKPNEALSAFRQAYARAPNPSDASQYRASLAHCKRQLAYEAQVRGDHTEAIGLYREALAIDDREPAAWYNLAMAYHARGDLSAAADAMEHACELDPGDSHYQDWREELAREAE